mmetsp:Transcript_28816/g.91840  ORF Transcript_28816/g.91840 Transcript_28816/m.91840 type:complete len:212 (+) Transcript_28816:1007-1642(+)
MRIWACMPFLRTHRLEICFTAYLLPVLSSSFSSTVPNAPCPSVRTSVSCEGSGASGCLEHCSYESKSMSRKARHTSGRLLMTPPSKRKQTAPSGPASTELASTSPLRKERTPKWSPRRRTPSLPWLLWEVTTEPLAMTYHWGVDCCLPSCSTRSLGLKVTMSLALLASSARSDSNSQLIAGTSERRLRRSASSSFVTVCCMHSRKSLWLMT